jgi:Tfp pilus assembly protein PilV
MNNRKSNFTLVEVAIAIAILAMGIAAAMGIIGAAKQRMSKAESQWRRQHALAQAAEYLLLAPPDTPLPRTVFDYPEFTVTISNSSPENLPENVPFDLAGWQFSALHINLIAKDGKLADSIVIDRLLRGGKP